MSEPDLIPKPREVIFIFDVMSPFSFLASRRINALCHREGLTVRWHPVFLAGVVKATGNQTPVTLGVQPKIRWVMQDYHQQAEALGIRVTDFPSPFPQSSLAALRALMMVDDDTARQRAIEELFRVMFERGESIEDRAAVVAAFHRADLPGERLWEQSSTDEAKARLRANSDAAVAAGAFGVPTFLVRTEGKSELFWGNDRLAFAIQRAAGKPLMML